MFETMRKMMLVGLGVQEKAREMLDEMVAKGTISREDGDSMLNKLMGQAEANVNTMEAKMKEIVASLLATMNLPTKREVDELRGRVAALEKAANQRIGGGA